MKKVFLSTILSVLSLGVFANTPPLSKTCYSAKGSISCGGDKQYYDTGCFDTAEELGQYLGELLGLICPPSE